MSRRLPPTLDRNGFGDAGQRLRENYNALKEKEGR